MSIFATGVALNLGNPKTPLFYVALLPNVVGTSLASAHLGILIAVILAVEIVVIGGHVVLAGRARSLLRTPRIVRRVNRAAPASRSSPRADVRFVAGLFPALCLGLIDDLAKKGDVTAKGPPSCRRGADPCLRPTPDKKFFNVDIASSGQCVEMCPEIAVGGFDHGFQLGELQGLAPFQRVQDGHDPETRTLVDNVVGAHQWLQCGKALACRRVTRQSLPAGVTCLCMTEIEGAIGLRDRILCYTEYSVNQKAAARNMLDKVIFRSGVASRS